MMKNRTLIQKALATLALIAHAACICAQSTFASDIQMDLHRGFEILTQNRYDYNRYNDSIFIIKDRDQWITFFMRRARKNHEIYESNKAVINGIASYFTNDSIEKSSYDYDVFCDELLKYIDNKANDPFIVMHFCKILERYYESGKCPRKLCNLPKIYSNISFMAYQISQMGNDSSYIKMSYDYCQRCLDPKFKGMPEYDRIRLNALRNVCTTLYCQKGWQTLDEMNEQAALFKQLMHSDTIHTHVTKSEAEYKNLLSAANQYEENVIRNVYMVDSTVLPKHTADSLMRIYIARNNAAKEITPSTLMRTYIMMAKVGDITNDEALRLSLDAYDKRWQKLSKGKVDALRLSHFIQPIFDIFYLIDISSKTYTQKRKLVKKICADIEDIFSRRADQQADSSYVKYINKLTTYDRVTKYLTYDERLHFLQSLNVATQVTTYAHSIHVGIIAKMLTQAITEQQPELLAGMLGCRNASEARKKAKYFADTMYEAAVYHDLGKNSIIPVVNNDYRPLYDEEFAIIKRHPELGLQYLALSPSLAKYHDTTLGHHKWYNGKGGYPDSFDNTKSPYRTLIDLLTISDCLQAATERVGRNYKGEKTFDTVMEEFRKQAGTRYNPDLVRFIDEHKDVADWLRNNLNMGWFNIYYDIYNNYKQ